jgi:hypothetical protein
MTRPKQLFRSESNQSLACSSMNISAVHKNFDSRNNNGEMVHHHQNIRNKHGASNASGHQRLLGSSADNWTMARSGAIGRIDSRSGSVETNHGHSHGHGPAQRDLSRERSQEIMIQPGTICLDNTHTTSATRSVSNIQTPTTSMSQTPRDQTFSSQSGVNNCNIQLKEASRSSSEFERADLETRSLCKMTNQSLEKSTSYGKASVSIPTDRTISTVSPEAQRRKDYVHASDIDINHGLTYGAEESRTKELLQMKEMHALLLHRECQSLANRIIKLEKELAACGKREAPVRPPTEEKSTSTDFIPSEYSSVYHCCTCSCQEQDQPVKCKPKLT